MNTYGSRADLPVGKQHFHVLKHSIATHLLGAGADLRFVRDWLGRSNIQNTVVYTYLTSKTRETTARKVFLSMPRYRRVESIIDIDRWTLTVAEREVVMRKSAAHRLDVALLLKFFQSFGRFPTSTTEIEPAVVEYVAAQLDITVSNSHALKGRTLERVRSEIRALCGFREAAVDDAAWLTDYLREHVVSQTRDHERLAAAVLVACRERRVEPPTDERIERIIRHAVNTYEERCYAQTLERLTPSSRAALDALLSVPAGDDASDRAVINTLRADAGRIGINSIKDELAKLELIRKLDLPADLFAHAQTHELELCRRRVAVEAAYELRRHPEATRLTWLAAFAYLRGRAITDTLTELLVDTVHRIGTKADRRVSEARRCGGTGPTLARRTSNTSAPGIKTSPRNGICAMVGRGS